MSTAHWPLAQSERFDRIVEKWIGKSKAPRIREIADAAQGSLRLATYRLLLTLKDLPLNDLLNPSKVQAHLLAHSTGAGLDPERNSWKEVYARIVRAGGLEGIESLRGKAVAKRDIAGTMSFDLLNPHIIEAIQTRNLTLIQGVSQDAAASIRAVLLEGYQRGLNPRQQAIAIRPFIGLTTQQTRAVQNYRAALESGRYRQALDNVLRDKRYDARTLAALREGRGLSTEQIDTMVNRYAERQLKHRAEMIARSESISAANLGQRETWWQAQQQGLLPETMRQHWLPAHDERTCKWCPDIPRLNPGGVRIGTTFASHWGQIEQPPAHTACRCSIGIR